MTKYEWETELKKNICRLPADEVKRVLEYYGELFDDMAERGKSEREIINEFGNPADVADNIFSEFEDIAPPERAEKPENAERETPKSGADKSENGERQENSEHRAENASSAEYAKSAKSAKSEKNAENAENAKNIKIEKSGGHIDVARLVLFVLFNVFTGGFMFIAVGVVWILLAAFTVCGAAFVLGGGVSLFSSFALIGTGHAGAGIAQFGISVALAGLGLLMTLGCVMLIKLYGIANAKLFGGIRKLLTVKEG